MSLPGEKEFTRVLNQGHGYGIVVGLGFAFATVMVGLTWVQAKFTRINPNAASEFSVSFSSRLLKSISIVLQTASRSIKAGLICCGITSAWTWSATLLQSSAATYQSGLSAAWWYGVGGTIQIAIFSMIAAKVKMNANGVTTFLQIVKARFGVPTHLLFTFYALVCVHVVYGSLVLGASATVQALTGMSVEACNFLMPIGIAVYVIAGGLRATFICDFIHTVILFAILYILTFVAYGTSDVLGSPGKMWDLLQDAAITDPVRGNAGGSYTTMRSNPGVVFAACTIASGFSGVFCDQGYWQRAIASRPESTTKAYMLGALSWFSIPWAFGTVMAMSRLGSSTTPSGAVRRPRSPGGIVPPTTTTPTPAYITKSLHTHRITKKGRLDDHPVQPTTPTTPARSRPAGITLSSPQKTPKQAQLSVCYSIRRLKDHVRDFSRARRKATSEELDEVESVAEEVKLLRLLADTLERSAPHYEPPPAPRVVVPAQPPSPTPFTNTSAQKPTNGIRLAAAPRPYRGQRLILNFRQSANKPGELVNPQRLCHSLNKSLPTSSVPILRGINRSGAGNLVLHAAEPFSATYLRDHADTIWDVVKEFFKLSEDDAPSFDDDIPWQRLVIHRVPLPMQDGSDDEGSSERLDVQFRTGHARLADPDAIGLREVRPLVANGAGVDADTGEESECIAVALLLVLEDQDAAREILRDGVFLFGTHCRVSQYVPRKSMRRPLILLATFMAATSASSAELIAVSSIIVYVSPYDILGTYWKKLSGKQVIFYSHIIIGVWAIWMGAWATILHRVGIDLGWLFYIQGVALTPAVVPIGLTVCWKRLSAVAAFGGTIIGTVCGMIGWMVPDDYDWQGTRAITSAAQDDTSASPSEESSVAQDEKDVKGMPAIIDGEKVTYKPASDADEPNNVDREELQRVFVRASYISGTLTFIILILIPMPLFGQNYIFSRKFFSGWVAVSMIWLLMAGGFCILLPIWESRTEMQLILTGLAGSRKKKVGAEREV
ncbi:Na+/solute symporter [Mycena kentingensis (nom. inval.)]|nr:Na+/solute symporter [Mycena kentingensis (nom. inval.)]